MKCPYCQAPVYLENSSKVYNGRDYGMLYICSNYPKCDSYVGCHQKTQVPFGKPANAELRNLRQQCHDEFDAYWNKKGWSRNNGYKWMQKVMKLSSDKAHIGQFRKGECNYLLKIMRIVN